MLKRRYLKYLPLVIAAAGIATLVGTRSFADGHAMGPTAARPLGPLADPGDGRQQGRQGHAGRDRRLRNGPRREIDANHDGKITADEVQAFREKERAKREAAEFARMDTNGDGSVSVQEYEAAQTWPWRGWTAMAMARSMSRTCRMAARMAAGCITVIIPGQTTTPPSRTVGEPERPMTGRCHVDHAAPRGRAAVPQAGPRRTNWLTGGRPADRSRSRSRSRASRRCGDGPACAALVDRHLARVTALAGRMLGNRADAEDVAQEVFLRVWQQAAKWRRARRGSRRGSHRVTLNLCHDRLRRRREVALDAAGELPSGAPSPGADMQRAPSRPACRPPRPVAGAAARRHPAVPLSGTGQHRGGRRTRRQRRGASSRYCRAAASGCGSC